MDTVLSGVFVVTVIAVAFALFVAGHRIVYAIGVVRRLRSIKLELSNIAMDGKKLDGVPLDVVSLRPLYDIARAVKVARSAAKLHSRRTTGTAFVIVHHQFHVLDRLVRELKVYSFLIMLLSFFGTLAHLESQGFEFSIAKLWSIMCLKPFSLLAMFEVFMVVLILFRLMIELIGIRELIEEAL